MYAQYPQTPAIRITPLGVLVFAGVAICIGYGLRKPIFHYSGMSLQRRR